MRAAELDTTVPSRRFSRADFERLMTKMQTGRGFQASLDQRFRAAIFGRDSLWIGRFLCPHHARMAKLALVTTAATQGIDEIEQRAEEPGKIAHETRDLGLPGTNEEITRTMIERFGEIAPGIVSSYMSFDATPLWVILLAEYCRHYGTAILGQVVRDNRGNQFSLADCFVRAMGWIERRLDRSALGLFECDRLDESYRFQVLRDGGDSYKHEDGTLANTKDDMAYLEVQGYVYDALVLGAALIDTEDAARARRWRQRAARLRHQTVAQFWMDDRRLFAAALDRDGQGQLRQVTTLTSVPLEFLGSHLLHAVPREDRRHYIGATVQTLMTEQFLTDAGLRAMARDYDFDPDGKLSYQGPHAVWPIISHLGARGLRHIGFDGLARDLAIRTLNAITACGDPRELWYVSPDGRVAYDPKGRYDGGDYARVKGPIGERQQAWTVAAAVEMAHFPTTPLSRFERRALQVEPARYWRLDEARAAFDNRWRLRVDDAG